MIKDDTIQQMAEQHVARSLTEMSDESKVDGWQNGERAKEQAAEIVRALLVDVHNELEQRSKGHAG